MPTTCDSLRTARNFSITSTSGGNTPIPRSAPRPGIILLDLNMPRKDGREALQELKKEPRFRGIRVVIMTTSKAEEDVVRSYDLSAASYITKPVTFERLVEVIQTLGKYWLEIVELPPNGTNGNGNATP